MNFFHNKLVYILAIVGLLLTSSCQVDNPDSVFYDKNDVTILLGLEKNDDYSEYVNLVYKSGLNGLLGVYGSYTVFVFSNDALNEYKKENSITDFSQEEAKRLIEYHILGGTVTSDFMGNGGLNITSIADDYYEASLSDKNEIIINRSAKIILRDKQFTNGYVQQIDKVLKPKDYTIRDIVFNDPGLTFFKELWIESQFDNTYNKFQEGSAKTPMTLFVVPDSVYVKNGLNSVADIKNLPSIDNDPTKLKEFFAYHAMSGMNFLNQLQGGNYSTYGKEMLNIKVENVFKLNQTFSEEEVPVESYVSIHSSMSNMQARNGVCHILGNILIPMTPKAEFILFDFAAQPELMYRPEYGSKSIKGIQDWEFSRMKIQISGGQVDYSRSNYWVDHRHYYNKDIISPTGGKWNLEFITPMVSAGKYRMVLRYKNGGNRAIIQCFFDGEKVGDPINMKLSKSFARDEDVVKDNSYFWYHIKDVDFETTQEHIIKFSTVVGGAGCLDGIEFQPIND